MVNSKLLKWIFSLSFDRLMDMLQIGKATPYLEVSVLFQFDFLKLDTSSPSVVDNTFTKTHGFQFND